VLVALLVRDELRWYRGNREATAVRQAVEDSTLLVRKDDELPALRRGKNSRRKDDHAERRNQAQ
jgi:hypothetical protein